MDRSRPVRSASFGSSGPRQGANTVEDRTQPIAGSYGLARPAKTGWHSAERSIHGKDRVGSRASVTRTSSPSSRHLISPLTVLRELRRCRLAWRSPPTRSHGGSQGFKSPHLHPTTALVTGLAGHFRRAGAVPGSRSGQQTGSNREQTANRYSIAAKRRSGADTYPTFRLRDGRSASTWTAPDGTGLLTSDASSVQTDPDGSRWITWTISALVGSKKSSVTSLVLREQASVGLLSARARRGLRGPADQTGGEGQDQDVYRSRTEEGGRILVRHDSDERRTIPYGHRATAKVMLGPLGEARG